MVGQSVPEGAVLANEGAFEFWSLVLGLTASSP